MTTKQFVALGKSLLPALPGFAIKGSLMFLPPVTPILRGLSFEGSSFSKTPFYVHAFVLPLCVRHTYVSFNFGCRVSNPEPKGWDSEMPDVAGKLASAVAAQALPFLLKVDSLAEFIPFARKFAGNPHTTNSIAMAYARMGHFDEALRTFEQLLGELDHTSAWQGELDAGAKSMIDLIVAKPQAAKDQLEAWERQSAFNLRLA